MTSEQLQNARAERWCQASNPIVTADDARAWIEGVGFSLFLPHRAHFFAPAPSFVEAVAGAPSDAPAKEVVEQATALLHRLTADRAVIPLHLFGAVGAFGTAGAGGSDQPDFLVTRGALAYVFSLIGGRNWKSGPGAKASPLMTEIWTLLNEQGALTAQEIQTALGRELTEGAVLRGLAELWNGLRVIPVYDGGTTRWELTQARFAAELTASQKVAQATALSALVSLYLESAIAASGEEVETFLSPLAARSKVREVVNGLQATRQLGLVSVAAQPLVHVAGSLPEFAEPEPVEAMPETGEGGPSSRQERAGFERRPRPAREQSAERGPFKERGERGGFGRADRREGHPERRGFDGERKSFGKKPPFEKTGKPFDQAKPFRERREGERSGERGERRAFGAGGKFPPKRFGAGAHKPWQERGQQRPSARSEGERPLRPRREEDFGAKRFGGEKRFSGERRPAAKKFGAPKPAWREKPSEREKAFGAKRVGGRRESDVGKWKDRQTGGGQSSFSGGFKRERPAGKRPFFRERPAGRSGEGESRSGPRSAPREGGWKPKRTGGGFAAKSGGRGFQKAGRPEFRREGKPSFKSSSRPAFGKLGGEERPAKRFGRSGKPFGKPQRPFGDSTKPFGRAKPAFDKPGSVRSGSGRPGKPAFGKGRPGASGSGGSRPAGSRPPFRKRKREEGGNAE